MITFSPGQLALVVLLLLTGLVASQEAVPAKSEDTAKVIVNGQVFNGIGSGVQSVAIKLELIDEAGSATLIGEATTDGMGDFAIRSEKSWTGKGRVSFSKTDYMPETRDVDLAPGETPFVDLQLRGNLSIKGKISDGLTEKPIAEAKVRLMTVFGERETQTREDGAFEVAELDPGPVRIVVEAEGFANEKVEQESVAEAGSLDIRLQPERKVKIRIEDERQAPVPTATVEVLVGRGQDYRMGVTDESGELMVKGLSIKDTTLQLRLDHPNHVRDMDFSRTLELPSDQPLSSHTITLQPAGSAAGTVLATESGKPIAGARVGAGPVWSDRMPQQWTDEEGRFQIGQLPTGPLAFTVHIAGFAPDLQIVEIKPGEQANVQFKLDSAAELHGTVVDAEGKPVPRAVVFAERWRDYATLGIRSMSDDQGNFVLSDVPRDEFFVGVTAGGFQRLSGQSATATATPIKLTLTTAKSGPSGSSDQPGVQLTAGQAAPAFEVKTLDGQTLSLTSLRGKTVVLDFWATWCAPCVGEIPNLQKVYEQHGTRSDFVLLGLTLEDDAGKVRKFAGDRKMSWPLAVGQDGGAMTAATAYGVMAIPSVFVIDPEGNLLAAGVIPSELPGILAKPPASTTP